MALIRLGRYTMEVTVSRLSDSIVRLSAAVGRAEGRWPTDNPDVAALNAQIVALQQALASERAFADGYADQIDALSMRIDSLGTVPMPEDPDLP